MLWLSLYSCNVLVTHKVRATDLWSLTLLLFHTSSKIWKQAWRNVWPGISVIVAQTNNALTVIVSNIDVAVSMPYWIWMSSQSHRQRLSTLHNWVIHNLNCDAPSFTRIHHKSLVGSSSVVASICNIKLQYGILLVVSLSCGIVCTYLTVKSSSYPL